MIKMDVIILLGAMFLAYGGIILLYHRMRVKERKTKISNFMLKGTMNMRQDNPERALTYFNRAYKYSININNKADAAEALYNIGHIYREKGKTGTAMKYWEQAKILYHKINDNEGNKKIRAALKLIKN